MANQISADKQRVTFAVHKKLIAQIDAEADKLHLTRTDIIVRACREHLRLDPIPASASQMNEIQLLMAQLVQEQEAASKNLMDAIERHPALEAADDKSKMRRIWDVLKS